MTSTTARASGVEPGRRDGRRTLLPVQLCTSELAELDRQPQAWAWQIKYDGWRAQWHVRSGQLLSRHGSPLHAQFPHVCSLTLPAGDDHVLDGELVCLDALGRPDFAALSSLGLRSSARQRPGAPTGVLVVFDVLICDGADVRALPWQARQELLSDLVPCEDLRPACDPVVRAPVFDDGPALIQATFDLGLEGVVAKRRTVAYTGGRSRAWVKVKHAHARDSS